MNKGKNSNVVIFVVIAIALFLVGYFFIGGGSASTTTDSEGFNLRLYDSDGNLINIPQEFSGYAIWTTETPITCSIDANCPTGTTCWDNECVIRGVASMALDFSVKSQSADVTYNNLHITSATPSEWSNQLPTDSRNLAPSATSVFTQTIPFSIPSVWEGSSQTFSVTIAGTSDYDGTIVDDTKSISYKFYADPTGGFTVNIINPFA